MDRSLIRNNVSHAGLDWKSPFQINQDGNFQGGFNGGKCIVENNILLGSGKSGMYRLLADLMNGTPHPFDTVFFRNNSRASLRGNLANFVPKTHDSKTSYFFESNYIREMNVGTIQEVYNNWNRNQVNVVAIELSSGAGFDIVARNNRYDNTITSFSRTNNPVLSNNIQGTVPLVQFRHFMGSSNHFNFTNNFDYTRFERYTNLLPN
jgi:hypothetical protein